jgi:hypothetical protein
VDGRKGCHNTKGGLHGATAGAVILAGEGQFGDRDEAGYKRGFGGV